MERLGGQAYYDDALNITWQADANLANSNNFGIAGINGDGSMGWNTSNHMITAMNSGAGYPGTITWRLPAL